MSEKGERKRVTITLEGKILKWLNKKIEEKVFHNYQHAIEYCLLQVYSEEERFEHFNVYEDHVTIWDKLEERLVDVYFQRGKAYCQYCDAHECEHTRFALSIPKVVKALREKGWIIEDGKVIRGPF